MARNVAKAKEKVKARKVKNDCCTNGFKYFYNDIFAL